MTTPKVLFVCQSNSGKSQMAAGLMRQLAGDRIEVHSAGTDPGTALNALSEESLREVGADMSAEYPKTIDPALVRDVDVVVVLGRQARVEPVAGTRFETWDTDEPSERGIEGIERMRLIRDDIAARVQTLAHELNPAVAQTDKEKLMSKIEVFEPALCCATGVCGDDVDQQLVTFSADMDFIRSRGGDITRYNLASEPQAFADNDAVKAFLHLSGSAGLPLILVDGVTAMTGRYPDRTQLSTWAGLDTPVGLGITEAGGCCGGSASGCC